MSTSITHTHVRMLICLCKTWSRPVECMPKTFMWHMSSCLYKITVCANLRCRSQTTFFHGKASGKTICTCTAYGSLFPFKPTRSFASDGTALILGLVFVSSYAIWNLRFMLCLFKTLLVVNWPKSFVQIRHCWLLPCFVYILVRPLDRLAT